MKMFAFVCHHVCILVCLPPGINTLIFPLSVLLSSISFTTFYHRPLAIIYHRSIILYLLADILSTPIPSPPQARIKDDLKKIHEMLSAMAQESPLFEGKWSTRNKTSEERARNHGVRYIWLAYAMSGESKGRITVQCPAPRQECWAATVTDILEHDDWHNDEFAKQGVSFSFVVLRV